MVDGRREHEILGTRANQKRKYYTHVSGNPLFTQSDGRGQRRTREREMDKRNLVKDM